MSYQIDHTLSGAENFARLASAAAVDRPFGADELVATALQVVAPDETNNFANTSVSLEGAEGAGWLGTTQVTYKRTTLANNRPTAGTKFYIDSSFADHDAVHAAILDLHQLVADQVVFTDPANVPSPQGKLDYVLNPVAGSLLYIPGALTISVANTDPFVAQDPSAFFGAEVSTQAGLKVFEVPTTPDWRWYCSSAANGRANFIRMMNFFQHLSGMTPFNENMLNVGAPEVFGLSGRPGNTLVKVSLKDSSVVTQDFYLHYKRFNPSFNGSWDSGPFSSNFKGAISPALGKVVSDHECFPTDAFTQGAVTGVDNPTGISSREISYTWLDGQYITLGGETTTYSYFW